MSLSYLQGDSLHPSFPFRFAVEGRWYTSARDYAERHDDDLMTGYLARYAYDHKGREGLKETYPYLLLGEGSDVLETVRSRIMALDAVIRELPIEEEHVMIANVGSIDTSRVSYDGTQVVSRPRYCVRELERDEGIVMLQVTMVTPLRSIYRRRLIDNGYLYFNEREAFIVTASPSPPQYEVLRSFTPE